MTIVFWNGDFVDEGFMTVSPLDRSFLFGDGLYEVMRIYDGAVFCWDEHFERLRLGAEALDLVLPVIPWREAMSRLVRENAIANGQLYLQVSRGVAPRAHSFHNLFTEVQVIANVQEKDYSGLDDLRHRGVAAILHEDWRWKRRDIKSVNLLANCMAKTTAERQGAFEALLHEGEFLTEGSHTNVFAIFDGKVATTPLGPHILAGITRALVIDLAKAAGLIVEERFIGTDEIYRAEEVFVTGTTSEILPVTFLDGRAIGSGAPGPKTKLLVSAFNALIGRS